MAKNQFLPCILCGDKFSEEDIKAGLYFISTMVCKGCYDGLQSQPHSVSCFGKLSVRRGRRVDAGYDKEAVECSEECPDRFICRAFVKQVKAPVPAV